MVTRRDNRIDIVRGVAMILVIMGHCMHNNSIGSENTVIYRVIWSVQMPLFMMISGYLAGGSVVPSTFGELGKKLLRRTVNYIWPWFLWSILIRGVLIDGEKPTVTLQYYLRNMDAGYWFLFVLWVISLLFTVGQFAVKKVTKRDLPVLVCLGSGMLAVPLLLVGIWQGMSFLGIKLILYYLPFYLLGYLGWKVSHCSKAWISEKAIQWGYAASLAVFLGIVAAVPVFQLGEKPWEILIRITASVSGCLVVVGVIDSALCCANVVMKKLLSAFAWIGRHSLEIYILHYFPLRILANDVQSEFLSLRGLGMVAVCFGLTVAISALMTWIMSLNCITRALFWGRSVSHR